MLNKPIYEIENLGVRIFCSIIPMFIVLTLILLSSIILLFLDIRNIKKNNLVLFLTFVDLICVVLHKRKPTDMIHIVQLVNNKVK